ncbi:response regulator [Arenibacter sp. GZD96]|uniref:response regulator n=1 Tax=Aurantibrevibacter litoralis TaxID=3106030 RepID=UPI002AFED85E|nr:response regulator [Arenibacter sp. GZD-96]MEA1784465.1 response regulator [Arenibacter sp. GZD-96]
MNVAKKLSIIDDDDTFIYLTKKTINKISNVELIKVFSNGLDAITFLKENKTKPETLPEIILLDLSMPIMDGWQFLEEYAVLNPKIGKKITIYICSSSISPEDIVKSRAISEVTDFIIKPISREQLEEMIEKL